MHSKSQFPNSSRNQTNPIIISHPQVQPQYMMYPYFVPPSYYPQYQNHPVFHKNSRNSPEQDESDILKPNKTRYKKPVPVKPIKKKNSKNMFKICALAVYYFLCLRNEAKKSACIRRKIL